MQVDFLDSDDPRWNALLRTTPHDFYVLPGYVAMSARREGGRPVGVRVMDGDRQLLLPLVLRGLPGAFADSDLVDARSPYGYPGIVLSASGPADPLTKPFFDGAISAAIAALRERGVVSLFVRLHPLFQIDTIALARHGTVVDHGHTVSIDLRSDQADLFPNIRHDHARNLRKLDRLGFTTEIDETCRPESIAQFVEIYRQTMDRHGASDSYYVGADYIRELASALDGRLAIFLIRDGDVSAAAGIVTEMDGIVQSHISGTRDEYVKLAPSKLKVRESAYWARARGNRLLHLGGGLGGAEDALFYFKAGFSRERHLFQTARIIIDQAAYDELNTSWEGRAAAPAARPDGYFPAYRAPFPVVESFVAQPDGRR